MRPELHLSIVIACIVGCGSTTAVTGQPAYSTADDEAVLRDPVLDAVANPNATRTPTHRVPPDNRTATATTDAAVPVGRERARVGIRGITGSLTAFEIDEAMATRSEALMACVQQRPNRLGYVAGDIKFHVGIDGQGKVDRVHITESNIGYPTLEICLSDVVATAPFPTPAGQQHAEAVWQMSVDPLGREAEPIDSAELEDAITQQSEATYEACNIGHGRRFVVIGYVDRAGHFGSLSVRSPWRGAERTQEDSTEEIACLLGSLSEWKYLPKASHHAKAVFELHWVAAPDEPPPRRRHKPERNRPRRPRRR